MPPTQIQECEPTTVENCDQFSLQTKTLQHAAKRSLGVSRILSSYYSTVPSFKSSELEVVQCEPASCHIKPDPDKLMFGKSFTDHMLEIEYNEKTGWKKPKICPLHNLALHPAAKVLHYAVELFEGMKAYRSPEDKINLFRPDMNIRRMLATAERSGLPMFDGNEFLECLKKLILLDKEWVPKSDKSSLYIRPTLIGTEPTLGVAAGDQALLYVLLSPSGPYYPTGFKPVALLASTKYVRAWPGGCGDKKMGANYSPTVAIQRQAEKRGYQQTLWLFGPDHLITEVGAMNIFVFLKNKDGGTELVTPPLNGLILPGVTRQSLLDLTREMKEFQVSEREIAMKEVLDALKENRVLEIFGAGTACVVCPVAKINYEGKDYNIPTLDHNQPLCIRLFQMLTDIQYGRVKHPWSVPVE